MQSFRSLRRRVSDSKLPPALLAAALVALAIPMLTDSRAAVGGDTTAPTAPTDIRLVEVSETTAKVSWTRSTDNVRVAGYRVLFGTARHSRTPDTSFTQTGLACGLSYAVEVRAYDDARNLSPPARAVVSTAPCLDVNPPSAPNDLRQVANSPTTVSIAWEASLDDIAVAGYALSLGGMPVDTTTETSYVFVGLRCSSTYMVTVRAYDVARNESAWVPFYASTSACGDSGAPTAPVGLVQLDRTQTTMSVRWSPSIDDVGVASYVVFRDGTRVAETPDVTYGMAGLACGTAYTIGVEAVDDAGNVSPRSSAVMSTASCAGTPPGGDTQPPSTPTGLAVESVSASVVTISWSPSFDDAGVMGYDVFRDGIRTHVVSSTRYSFVALSCGRSYSVAVAAYDAAGNRSESATITVGTSPCADASAPSAPAGLALLARTSTSVSLSWAASSDDVGVVGYGAYRDGELLGSTVQTTYTFAGLACNTSRTFGIDAYDAAGNRSARANVVVQTAACGDVQAPSSPAQLAITATSATGFTLSWAASSDDVGVPGYDVFANGAKVATVTGTSAVLGNLACGTSYQLGVEAFDSSGNRSARASVTASTAACSSAPPAPPSGGTVFVAPNGSDSASCAATAPCASFARAYQVAESGETVEIAGGSYPVQTLPRDESKDASRPIVFKPAPGASVTLAGFDSGNAKQPGFGARGFELRDLAITDTVYLRWGVEDVVLRNIDAGRFVLTSVRRVEILGGDFGPMVDQTNHIQSCGEPGCFASEDVLIEGAYFHDFTISYADKHSECLMLWPGRRVTIRNSIFRNCTDYDVFVKPGFDLTFENNFFDEPMPGDTPTVQCNPTCPRGGPALAFSAGSGMTVRYNSFGGAIRLDPEVSGPNVFKGNAGRNSTCWSNATFSFNVWSGTQCSASDRSDSMSDLFVDPSASGFDLHLKNSSAAIDAGDPADHPADDIDGEGRPQGVVDAGADERS